MLAFEEDMAESPVHAASAAEAPSAALKSTDTSNVKAVLQQAEAPKEPKPAATPPAKVEAPSSAESEADAGNGEAGDEARNAPDGDHASSADASGKKRERLPRWMQERMKRERLQVQQETREAVLREIQQQQQPQRRAETEIEATREQTKTLADFNFDMEAYTDHKVQLALQREAQRAEQRETERRQTESAEQFKTKIDAFETRVGAGAWDDIRHSPINTDPAFASLTSLFMGDPNDLDIALHLANNLTEAHRINALPPLQRVREMAKLAEQFAGEGQGETKPEPLPKKTTNAPPPPKTVSGAGKPVVDINSPDLSTEDRIRLWKQRKG